MPEAFILFKTEPTHEREVYLSLTGHEDVAEVHALYGEFDLLVRITAPDSKRLSDLVMNTSVSYTHLTLPTIYSV